MEIISLDIIQLIPRYILNSEEGYCLSIEIRRALSL